VAGLICQKSAYICWDLLRNAEHIWEFPLGYPSFSFSKEPYINEPLYLLGSCGKHGALTGAFSEVPITSFGSFFWVPITSFGIFNGVSWLPMSSFVRNLYPSVLISLSFKRAQHSHHYRLVSFSKELNIPIFWTILIYPPIGSVLRKNLIFAGLFWETLYLQSSFGKPGAMHLWEHRFGPAIQGSLANKCNNTQGFVTFSAGTPLNYIPC